VQRPGAAGRKRLIARPAAAVQRVVVVAVLVELETPDVSPGLPLAVAPPGEVVPGAPMELVLPVEPVVLPLLPVPAVLEVSLPAAGGVGVVVTLFSVVVVEVLDEVVGVAVSSRLVQAPRDTAATSAIAAHEVRDAFIRKLLEVVVWTWKGRLAPPYCAL